MGTHLRKQDIEALPGEPGKVVRIRHGDTRLFLRIDRRSPQKIVKVFYFEREFQGTKLRIKLGEFPAWSVLNAEAEAKRLDVLCDQGRDPRVLRQTEIKEAHIRRQKERAGNVTLAEVWDAYLDARQRDIRPLKPLTVRDYRKHLHKTFAVWANQPIRHITREAVLVYYRDLVAKIGPAQANQAIRSLRAVFNWVIECNQFAGALEANPVAVLKNKLHKVQPRTNSLERTQIASWWAAVDIIPNPVPRAYLRLLLLTGMRREEALSLRWADVDFRWGTLTIQESKNGDRRIIPLTAYVAEMLQRLPRVNEWVFYSPSSQCGRMREPAKHITKIANVIGLHIPSHDLRRSFGGLVEWIELPDGAVKQLLGHKPGDVTQRHYKPRPLDLLRSMLQRYEDFILNETKSASKSELNEKPFKLIAIQ